MKESITNFDLEAAFKALDEIEVPKAKKGIKANRPALTEIFSRKSKFDALFEEYYDVGSSEGLDDAKEARDAEIAKAKLARIEKIVDLDADSPDDLLTSYVGKYIMQCPQCMTLFYKNQEDIEKSEEDPNTVNVSEICQHCGNDSGYTLIGKIGEAEDEQETPEEAGDEDLNLDSLEDMDLEGGADVEASEDEGATDEGAETDTESDSELEDLDLEIVDDETEEETTEEAFYNHDGGSYLAEQLQESTELDVSASEFSELINSPEFKKPVSDAAVRAMLATENTSEEQKINDTKTDTQEVSESINVNNETLKYAVINPDGTYAGVPCASYEEARELAAQKEGRIIVELSEVKKNSISLDEAGIADFGKALGKKIKQAAGTVKNKVSDAIDKFADSAKTRPEKASFIIDNVLEDDGKDKRFKQFVIIGFKDAYTNGKEITQAPNFDNKDLVVGEGQPITKDTFGDAEDYAKGWSLQQGNGPAFVYMARDINDEQAAPICQYFKGKVERDQLENYFKITKDNLAGKELTSQSEAAKTESLDTLMANIDELQENVLEQLISNSLIESYGNVAGFRLQSCSYLDEQLAINGTILFTSGKTRKTSFKFAEANKLDTNKTMLIGLNEKLGENKKFIITGNIELKTKTFIAESFKSIKNK